MESKKGHKRTDVTEIESQTWRTDWFAKGERGGDWVEWELCR